MSDKSSKDSLGAMPMVADKSSKDSLSAREQAIKDGKTLRGGKKSALLPRTSVGSFSFFLTSSQTSVREKQEESKKTRRLLLSLMNESSL